MKIYPKNNRFIKDVIESEEYKFVGHYPTVIDIGANIGTFSFWIYDMADEIFAIEPSEANISNMEKTVKENNLKKINVYQLAISNSNELKKMEVGGDPGKGGWRISGSGTYKVPCKTLKKFMDDNDIYYADLVKMDVEGHEKEILEAPYFPHERIGTIIGELHFGIHVEEILTYMGYRYYKRVGDKFLARKA